jgi:hypothetical protein
METQRVECGETVQNARIERATSLDVRQANPAAFRKPRPNQRAIGNLRRSHKVIGLVRNLKRRYIDR